MKLLRSRYRGKKQREERSKSASRERYQNFGCQHAVNTSEGDDGFQVAKPGARAKANWLVGSSSAGVLGG